jgi:hypothetical protein
MREPVALGNVEDPWSHGFGDAAQSGRNDVLNAVSVAVLSYGYQRPDTIAIGPGGLGGFVHLLVVIRFLLLHQSEVRELLPWGGAHRPNPGSSCRSWQS